MSAPGFRSVEPVNMDRVVPAQPGEKPELRWVDPCSLLIEASYQRDLTAKSITLIRKIVAEFDWGKVKPPICAEVEGGGMFVIDGQHTAIACASHPGVDLIPVVVVRSAQERDRAKAFVSHNRDRLALQSYQVFWSAVAAGDEDAQTAVQVAERAGAKILRYPPGNGAFSPGDLICTTQLMVLCRTRTAVKARQVLEVLVKACCAPVEAQWLRAVDSILNDPDFGGEIQPDKLAALILRDEDVLESEAEQLRILRKIPKRRALALAIYKRLGRGRK